MQVRTITRVQPGQPVPPRVLKERVIKGITLLEILVVVSIVAIVVALTFGGLAAAKKSAQTTSHLSGLRQLTTSVLLYGEDQSADPMRLKFFASAETLSRDEKLVKSGLLAFAGDPYENGWGNLTREDATFTGSVPFFYSPLGFADFVTEAWLATGPEKWKPCALQPFALFVYPAREPLRFATYYDISKDPSIRPILRARSDGSVKREYVPTTSPIGAHPFEVFGDLTEPCAQARDILTD